MEERSGTYPDTYNHASHRFTGRVEVADKRRPAAGIGRQWGNSGACPGRLPHGETALGLEALLKA